MHLLCSTPCSVLSQMISDRGTLMSSESRITEWFKRFLGIVHRSETCSIMSSKTRLIPKCAADAYMKRPSQIRFNQNYSAAFRQPQAVRIGHDGWHRQRMQESLLYSSLLWMVERKDIEPPTIIGYVLILTDCWGWCNNHLRAFEPEAV